MSAADPTAASSPGAPASRSAWLPTAIKAAITLALLGLVFWRVPADEVLAFFVPVRLLPLLAAFVWVAAAIVVSAVKWGRILRRRGIRVPLLELTRLYYIASFFNAVLPTSVGGDPVRAWLLGREKGELPEAFASVVSERLIASAALGLSSAIGLFVVGVTPRLAAFVLAFLVIDAGLVVLFVVPRVGERIVRAVIPPRYTGATEATRTALVAVRETLTDWPLVVEVLLITLAFQGCVSMVNYSLFAALGSPVTVGMALLYSPMISTISMLPVSLSGLGVPQAAYAYFFGLSGVPAAASVAVSLAFFATIAISTLPGAAAFVFARKRGETDGI
jgi:glycosyltransferase 2 family protein